MNSGDAISGFMMWLTAYERGLEIAKRAFAEESPPGRAKLIGDLINEFSRTNSLPGISEEYPNNIRIPGDLPISYVRG